VLHISKRPEPVNLVHCPSCDRHEPFCYSRRRRPTPKNTLRGNPGCAVGPKTPTMDVTLEPDLTYLEHPIRVLDQRDRVTGRRVLKFYKIQWNQHTKDEATWEAQDFLEKNFPGFLASYNL
jgi:hypothetical protein